MLKKTPFLLMLCAALAFAGAEAVLAQECTHNKQCPRGEYCRTEPGDCDGIGMCAWKPEACLDVWRPVCGCDGNTYSNSCYAALHGVSVDYADACGQYRGVGDPCYTNADCGGFGPFFSQYCRKDVGDCDGEGVCAVRPRYCLDVWDPVCGCDGNTYSNDCYAARAGVSVDYEGECAAVRDVGDPCYTNADCGFSLLRKKWPVFRQYCKKDVGDCDGEGVCAYRPEMCLDVWIPVCGCDGHTYSNHCYAARVGVNVDYEDACGATRGTCTTNSECGFREYCAKAIGDCDGQGVCTTRPRWCLDYWIPVCGCDGNHYSNPCYAARGGVNVEYMGYCPY